MTQGGGAADTQRSRFGIYFHVPFCAGVCPYCDFVKTGRFQKSEVDLFFRKVEEDLQRFLDEMPPPKTIGEWCTVYFGGGTPGMFPAERFAPLLERIRARFHIEECTVECNPVGMSVNRFRQLGAIGVDRVTLGVQSLCPRTLEILGRRHRVSAALEAIESARAAGIPQVQVDLIFGLQSDVRTTDIFDEVVRASRCGATGISGYSLTLEPRTRLGKSGLADEQNAVSEYGRLVESCSQVGFLRRETANFSRHEPKHNNIYWLGFPYVALGTGAHGLDFPSPQQPWGRRYRVGRVPEERAPGDDLLPFGEPDATLFERVWEEPRTADQVLLESVYTMLRMPDGVSWSRLEELLGSCEDDGSLEISRSKWMAAINGDSVCALGQASGRLQVDARGARLLGNEFLLGDGWATRIAATLERCIMRDDLNY